MKSFETRFVDRIGRITKNWGLSEPSGRVLGAIYISEGPISQRQISDITGYSLSLISPSLRILETNGLIAKMRGIKKERLYVATSDFVYAFNLFIKLFLERDIKPLISDLESLKGSGLKNRKIDRLISDYRRVEVFFGLYDKMYRIKKNTSEKVKKIVKGGL
jgi:DNA-binding transcriptional regulator GbsR (MarR family)